MDDALEVQSPADALASWVDLGEYARLLGYPRDRTLEGAVLEHAEQARTWFAGHATPWSASRRLAISGFAEDAVRIEGGEVLRSRPLVERLASLEATEIQVAVSTAGPETDECAAALWAAGKLDEAYFVDRFGAAAAEHLAAHTAVRLREAARSQGLDLSPGYSPGHDGWAVDGQRPLFRLLAPETAATPSGLELLPSGMVSPKNSLLALFALTHHVDRAESMWQRDKCSWCSLSPCAMRRTAPPGTIAS